MAFIKLFVLNATKRKKLVPCFSQFVILWVLYKYVPFEIFTWGCVYLNFIPQATRYAIRTSHVPPNSNTPNWFVAFSLWKLHVRLITCFAICVLYRPWDGDIWWYCNRIVRCKWTINQVQLSNIFLHSLSFFGRWFHWKFESQTRPYGKLYAIMTLLYHFFYEPFIHSSSKTVLMLMN